jgi:hypothetical protein
MTRSTHPTPEGPGSVCQAPQLPSGFADTFTSRYVDIGAPARRSVPGPRTPQEAPVHSRSEVTR